MWVHRCMVVVAGDAPLARALTAGIAGASGANMFLTPLSASGSLPVTHYVSTGLIQDSFAVLLPLSTITRNPDTGVETVTTAPGQPDAIFAACQALESPPPVTLAQINALLSAVDVSEQKPFIAFARLGLALVDDGLNKKAP